MRKRKFTLSTVEKGWIQKEETFISKLMNDKIEEWWKKEGYKLNLLAQFEPLVRLRIFYRGHGKIKEYKNVCITIFKMIYEQFY